MNTSEQIKSKIATLKSKYKRLKSEVGTLKVVANGCFGKLSSPYSCLYSPDMLLAVTISGQLQIMSLIYDLEFSNEVRVLSANTDGFMLQYPVRLREKILQRISNNAKRTGFEYEETRYSKIAMKDVNSYIAVTRGGLAVIVKSDGNVVESKSIEGKVKRKGLYAEAGLMKNPAAEICSDAVAAFLKDGTPVEDTIRACKDITKFVSCRAVKGGGIEYGRMVEVDDWEEIEPGLWAYPGMTKKPVKRKSPPPPRQVGVEGTPFGRIARWYMSTNPSGLICYAGSGNKVPKTDGAKLLMTLPDVFPDDINHQWYIDEAKSILVDVGVIKSSENREVSSEDKEE